MFLVAYCLRLSLGEEQQLVKGISIARKLTLYFWLFNFYMKAERSLESTGICELMYSSAKGIILGQDYERARTVLSSPEVVLDMDRAI